MGLPRCITVSLLVILASGPVLVQNQGRDKALLAPPAAAGEPGADTEAVQAEFAAGVTAYQMGDFAVALEHWTALAERDYGPAQFNLGVLYETGRAVDVDLQRAAHWYEKAAEHDIPDAYLNLGHLYARGAGVDRDDEMAAELFEAAAEFDLPEAQFNIGIAYLAGRGVDEDADEAAQWFLAAAEAGYRPAQYNIAAAMGDPQARNNRDRYAETLAPEARRRSRQRASAFRPVEAAR